MTLAELLLGVMFVGLIAYALFGGADFGAGIWDLLAGGTKRGARQRDLIEHSIAPVWEANHVWLIFVLVVLWTAFSGGFAAVVTTLYVPLTLAAFGMIARGAAFAFRKSISTLGMRRFFGAAFAISSLFTPFFLGTVVGGVASSRVPPGIAAGDVVTSWLNPTSILGGVLAVLVCAYLAAVFLCGDAQREGHPDLADQFRARALGTAALTGALGLGGIGVLRADAPLLFDGLIGRALPVIILSVLAGVASLGLLLRRRYRVARITTAIAVATILIGWAVAQYPYLLLPYLTVEDAARNRATLVAMTVTLILGSVILVPALVYMYRLFQRAPQPATPTTHATPTAAPPPGAASDADHATTPPSTSPGSAPGNGPAGPHRNGADRPRQRYPRPKPGGEASGGVPELADPRRDAQVGQVKQQRVADEGTPIHHRGGERVTADAGEHRAGDAEDHRQDGAGELPPRNGTPDARRPSTAEVARVAAIVVGVGALRVLRRLVSRPRR